MTESYKIRDGIEEIAKFNDLDLKEFRKYYSKPKGFWEYLSHAIYDEEEALRLAKIYMKWLLLRKHQKFEEIKDLIKIVEEGIKIYRKNSFPNREMRRMRDQMDDFLDHCGHSRFHYFEGNKELKVKKQRTLSSI